MTLQPTLTPAMHGLLCGLLDVDEFANPYPHGTLGPDPWERKEWARGHERGRLLVEAAHHHANTPRGAQLLAELGERGA